LSLGLKIHAGLRRATRHVPGKGAQMARYYGWCSNKMRGVRQCGRPPELALPRPGISPPPPLKLPHHPPGARAPGVPVAISAPPYAAPPNPGDYTQEWAKITANKANNGHWHRHRLPQGSPHAW